MEFIHFLPNYYGSIVRSQQSSIILDNLYFYVADGVTTDQSANNQPKDIVDEQVTINKIMYGGRVLSNNLIALFKNIPWQSGKVFAKYDAHDPLLSEKDFYCFASNRAVYKCLDNNKGSPSLVEPSTLVPGPFETSDGYIWTFLYQLTPQQLSDYSVNQYIPCIEDATVKSTAVPGTISTIDVVTPGKYTALNNGTIKNVISNTEFQIQDNAHSINGIYNDMGFYIDSGPGQGQLTVISDYVANSSGKFITVSTPLSLVDQTSTYDIAPRVNIEGNGNGAIARAKMVAGGVDSIEIISRGSYYTLANTSLVANTFYTTESAQLTTNLSPIKGHGSDLYNELYVQNVLFNGNLDNYTIANDFPVNDVTFSKVGLVRGLVQEDNPTQIYNNSSFNSTFKITATPAFGSFSKGDIIQIPGVDNPKGELVFANSSTLIGTYQHQLLRFANNVQITNQDGITATITDIVQPEVRFLVTDIVAEINTDTIQRTDTSNEIIQLIVQVRS